MLKGSYKNHIRIVEYSTRIKILAYYIAYYKNCRVEKSGLDKNEMALANFLYFFNYKNKNNKSQKTWGLLAPMARRLCSDYN